MHMSIKNFGGIVHIGTYNDHHKEATIHVPAGTNPADLIRAFMSESAEDINPDDPTTTNASSSVNPESNSGNSLFCRITKAAYGKGVAPQVDDELRSACVSAPKLVKALKTNDALGYTDTKDLYSTDLYHMLDEHYHLPFKLRTFQDCRNK